MQVHSHPLMGSARIWALVLPQTPPANASFVKGTGPRDAAGISVLVARSYGSSKGRHPFHPFFKAAVVVAEKRKELLLPSFCAKGDVPFAEEEEGEAEELQQLPDGWQWSRTPTELTAYALLLAAVPIVPLLPRFQWSSAFYFLFLALWSVYVGSHRSLAKKTPQKLSLKQGLAAPLLCSISLFGFYCLLRFFPDLNVRAFISVYLGIAGTVAVASNLVEPMHSLLPSGSRALSQLDLPKWLIVDEGRPVHFTITQADLVASLVAVSVAVASKQSGAPFTLNNLVAVCIATELLQLVSLGSFTIAAVMLSGLLLYDVFWVFGSSHVFGDNVMLKVATSDAFDGPMKLIFPHWRGNAANDYSILGLGDVAVPGLLTALMLRFDRARSKLSLSTSGDNQLLSEEEGTPDKTYFVTCIASYVFGLTLTVVANTLSGSAQPALLYLVPSLLFGVFLVAAVRSEASLLLEYKDDVSLPPLFVKTKDGM